MMWLRALLSNGSLDLPTLSCSTSCSSVLAICTRSAAPPERETEMTASDFTPGFKAAVDGLRSEIVDMVKTPRKRGSSILGGETMANIMVRLCDVVNGEEGISAPR